ncbi:unnamed protein product [Menidia menidia]|uniref:(Atlantic silverside) hypothetical protein n=1 Tax=Menidia menidia TaxID=238744 RepID=A0A8S4A5L2_9TELE|nr:unnamed protein product [Menidia menidia]
MGLLIISRLASRTPTCYLQPFSVAKLWLSTKTGPLRDKNIFLMGPPGAGKTTVGKIVAHKLGLPSVDIDDDVLEAAWGMPVASKLAAVGGRRFLEEEGQALLNLSASGCVVSLSGSNPLHPAAMRHARRSGLVVYLDVDAEDILGRLGKMRVDRVVGLGQEAGVSMRDVLLHRRRFYEACFDVRVLCGSGDTVEAVAQKVLRAVERYEKHDRETFISTRCDGAAQAGEKTYFSDVVVEGLAADGGLYVPENGLPVLDAGEWRRLVSMSYQERALVLLEKCIHPLEVSAGDLREMVFRAYGPNFSSDAVAPVRHLLGNQYVQELFHGPTASFKDLALQLMPQLFSHCLPPMCSYLVLVATSGDTGGAVLSGFGRLGAAARRRTGVLVFFPERGVSEVQKLQMTSYGGGSNARAVGVQSDFDFCQRAIKRMFGEAGLVGHLAVEYGAVLSTANSINWARLLPQVVYHSSGYLDLCRDGVVQFGQPVDICIPTGNLGNAMSALYAKRMGVPIRRVICASNHNRVVSDFIATGQYDLRGRPLLPSSSPAIDILRSSNLERLLHLLSDASGRLVGALFARLDAQGCFRAPGDLLAAVQRELGAGWCSEDDCLGAIGRVHAQTGYVLDPHTAVAQVVASRVQDASCPVLLCSTAHYGKFAPSVCRALGLQSVPEDPVQQLAALEAAVRSPGAHGELVRRLGGARMAHTVRQAEYGELAEEVEAMIQDSFLKTT